MPAGALLSRPTAASKRIEDAGSLARSAFLERKVQLASTRVEAAATLTVRLTEVVSLYAASPAGTLKMPSPTSGSLFEPTLAPLR